MKNLILIISLCFFQCACASQPQPTEDSRTLLRFSDLANEITVGFRDGDSKRVPTQVDDTPAGMP
jgi:hypothetical protein